MTESNSVAVTHGSCPSCGSTDACATYNDGHRHCFSCGVTHQVESCGSDKKAPSQAPDLGVMVPHHPDTLPQVVPITLSQRKLSRDTCAKYGYGVVTRSDRQTQAATYCDVGGTPVALKLRHADKRFEWLGSTKKAAPLYGQWLWRGTGRKIVVTEGELDCLSMAQAQGLRWPVVSVPNGAQSARRAFEAAASWLAGYDQVVIMFDMDEPGQAAAKECARVLKPGQAVIARLPLNDPSDMLVAGRTAEMLTAMWEATPYRPDGLVVGDELLEHLIRPVPPAVPFPFPQLHAVTGGLRRSEITAVLAGPGAGKSTFARAVALSLAEGGEKVGYVALEESVQRTVLDLVSMRLGRNLRDQVYGEGDVSVFAPADPDNDHEELAAAKWITSRFVLYDHFGSLDPDRLSDVMRHMIVAEGCNHIVLDHLSIVVSGNAGDDERKCIDRIMTKTRQLVQELGVGMIVVTHLRRRGGTPDVKSYEEGAIPRLSDCRGSAAIEQLSDTAIGLARNMTAEEDSGQWADLYVLKNRTMGRLGAAGTIRYDDETARMEPVERAMFDAVDQPKEHNDDF